MLKKHLAAFVLALTFAFCLAPGLALAADGALSAGDIASQPTLSTQAAAFTHKAFEVTSPEKDATYQLGETIDIKITPKKFIPRIVNGCLDSQINYIFLEICKDGKVKGAAEFWYGATPDNRWYAIGEQIWRTYTPKETGTYTIRLGWDNAKNARMADSVTDENYVGSYDFKVVEKKEEPVSQKANPIAVKAKKVTFSASKVKNKARSVKASKAFAVKNAKGTVTYKATKNVTKNAMKKVKVASDGKVTVKKGTKKGAYKLQVRVTAAGDATYKSGSKTVTLTVTVK